MKNCKINRPQSKGAVVYFLPLTGATRGQFTLARQEPLSTAVLSIHASPERKRNQKMRPKKKSHPNLYL